MKQKENTCCFDGRLGIEFVEWRINSGTEGSTAITSHTNVNIRSASSGN